VERIGRGVMKGEFMLQGWKNMHPEQHCVEDYVDLYKRIDDAAYIAREAALERTLKEHRPRIAKWITAQNA